MQHTYMCVCVCAITYIDKAGIDEIVPRCIVKWVKLHSGLLENNIISSCHIIL